MITDRGLRDDEDVPRHVNNTVLDGQRNDIEIFRCRDIISAAPVYQKYLAQVNDIKERYADCLLYGRYNDCLGFTCSNSSLDARAFVGTDRMAVVVANQTGSRSQKARISVPGYRFVEASVTGKGKISRSGVKVELGQYDMAVLVFEKTDVRIGTYNLRRAKLDRNSEVNNWDARLPRLVESFLRCNMDICGVQEVDTGQQESLPVVLAENGLEYGSYFFSPYAENGAGTKAHGLLWRKGRFEAGEPHFFWISDPPELMQVNDHGSSTLPGNFYRGGFCITLTDLQNKGARYFVMVTHAPLSPEEHAQNAHVYADIEKRYNPEHLPSFFVGDFNAKETDSSSQFYRSYWTDSYMYLGADTLRREGPSGTFNGWKPDVIKGPSRRIDYVYFRGKGVQPLRYVCDDRMFGGNLASDHYPVYVDFRINNK